MIKVRYCKKKKLNEFNMKITSTILLLFSLILIINLKFPINEPTGVSIILAFLWTNTGAYILIFAALDFSTIKKIKGIL